MPDPETTAQLIQLMRPPSKTTLFQAGKGCPQCVLGFAGRKPAFELFVVDPELSDMINRRCMRQEIYEAARKKGFMTLSEDILQNVYACIKIMNL